MRHDAHSYHGAGQSPAAESTTAYTSAALRIAELALAFGRVDRSVVTHRDGAPESDTDHTVALAWLAPALAAALAADLDPCRVAAYAAVHDAVEVFAGDTPTITALSTQRQADKRRREQNAVTQWRRDLGAVLPWLPGMIEAYELLSESAARFVKAVDKLAPKLVHLLNDARDLHIAGITPAAFGETITRQRAEMETYAGEFAALLVLYDDVTARVLHALAGRVTAGELAFGSGAQGAP